ncbi:Na(+)-translocating NADH-quinone reductase subunit F [Tepiditoga spiralis]|uniref:Na(+)-translocating NADH-quinone reductase subunit F n=1 Tax=Tepiditoga spiralis TaxID=2108365 RepID=A0A7G1G6P7_9BACT|nr:2Fe-2S iron-sulfur cluster binding domain-containing protein [Tepiditoga spiralis]BBE30814.1 Na(+)-translocating NADH-quinone reductase subunit F [Tepiditoga spiralis]
MNILTAPIIVAVLSAILATIIVIIDGIVNNYGEVTININGKKDLKVKGGSKLLTTLSEQKIFIPSACGGRGSCGMCKVKVISDVGPILPTEAPLLSKEEISKNIRLSCQIKIKSDIKIEIPEELFSVKKYKGKIVSIKDVTHDIKEVRIELPEEIEFKAGQYAQLIIPPYDKIKESVQRAYSIASKPSEKNIVEFLIRLVPKGIATTYVHTKLKENQNIDLIGPFGDFYVRETNADMICVAGGSGMAPIKSIIYDMYEKNIKDRNIWYFFGARSLKDLFYLEELRKIEKELPNFHFIPALSEPSPEDNWKGEVGLITDVLNKYLKENQNHKEGYLCGSPGMINACVNVMTKNGIKQEEIYYDNFA